MASVRRPDTTLFGFEGLLSDKGNIRDPLPLASPHKANAPHPQVCQKSFCHVGLLSKKASTRRSDATPVRPLSSLDGKVRPAAAYLFHSSFVPFDFLYICKLYSRKALSRNRNGIQIFGRAESLPFDGAVVTKEPTTDHHKIRIHVSSPKS